MLEMSLETSLAESPTLSNSAAAVSAADVTSPNPAVLASTVSSMARSSRDCI
jgi:hypothetical protein